MSHMLFYDHKSTWATRTKDLATRAKSLISLCGLGGVPLAYFRPIMVHEKDS